MDSAPTAGQTFRIIEFRCWNPRRQTMSPTGTLQDWLNTFARTRADVTSNPDIIFMQFTGLHDKNGKEIYEGDIVKWNGYVGEVFFWTGKKMTSSPGFYKADGGDRNELGILNSDHEVIGNRFENPELLTQGK